MIFNLSSSNSSFWWVTSIQNSFWIVVPNSLRIWLRCMHSYPRSIIINQSARLISQFIPLMIFNNSARINDWRTHFYSVVFCRIKDSTRIILRWGSSPSSIHFFSRIDAQCIFACRNYSWTFGTIHSSSFLINYFLVIVRIPRPGAVCIILVNSAITSRVVAIYITFQVSGVRSIIRATFFFLSIIVISFTVRCSSAISDSWCFIDPSCVSPSCVSYSSCIGAPSCISCTSSQGIITTTIGSFIFVLLGFILCYWKSIRALICLGGINLFVGFKMRWALLIVPTLMINYACSGRIIFSWLSIGRTCDCPSIIGDNFCSTWNISGWLGGYPFSS